MTHTRPLPRLLLLAIALCLVAAGPTDPAAVPSQPEPTTTGSADDPAAPADTPMPAGPTAPAAATALGMLPGGSNIAILPVEDLIYDFTLESLERRINRALADGADLIVLELDTNGGVVTSAIDICKFLKDPQKVPVPVVAWIHPKAYSAGIIIASACDEIVMSASSTTGDSAPIAMGQSLEPTERAKILSPILSEYRDNAAQGGYDYAIFHAMTVLGVKLYAIEHIETGRRRVVNQVDYALMVHGHDPSAGLIGSLLGSPSSAAGTADLVEVSREVATDADLGAWRPLENMPSGAFYAKGLIHGGTTLFTPDQTLALDIGLSKATLSSDTEILNHYNAASVRRIDQSWSENIAGILTHPAVKAILVAVLLIGTYMELQSPGFGLGGAVALAALLCLLAAPFVVGLSDIWFVLVFMLGLAMLVLELLFVPGFGLLGIAGVVLMLAGLVFSAVPTGAGPLPIPPREMWDRLLQSTLWTVLGLGGGLAGIAGLIRYIGDIPMLRRLVLEDHQSATADVFAATPLAGHDALGSGRLKVGDRGVTTTGLHPAGRAAFGDTEADVVSPGEWIEPGTDVRIIEMHGNRVVVETTRPPTT